MCANTVDCAVTGKHDDAMKIGNLPLNHRMHIALGRGTQLTETCVNLFPRVQMYAHVGRAV